MNKRYYYKVVQKIKNGQLKSCIDSCDLKSIVYVINRWVKPRNNRYVKGGPLAVFDTLENAENFINNFWHLNREQIWKCEIKKSKLKTMFYKYKNKNLYYSKARFLPKGTILSDKVKLIERIQ